MRRFTKTKDDRIAAKIGLLSELNFAGEIIAAVEILDFVGREIKVSVNRFCELKIVVVLGRVFIFVTGVDCAKKEWRLGRSVERLVSKSRRRELRDSNDGCGDEN